MKIHPPKKIIYIALPILIAAMAIDATARQPDREVHIQYSIEAADELIKTLNALQYANRDSALAIREILLDVSTRIGYNEGLRNVWNFTGIVEHGKSNYHEALSAYRKALEFAELDDNRWGMANIYGNMAITFREMSLNELDIEYKKRAMEIFQELGDEAQVNFLNVMIALSIMTDTRNLGEAEKYVRDAEAYYLKQEGPQINLIFLYNGLATMYQLGPDLNAYLYKTDHFNADSSAYYLEKAFSIPTSDFATSHLLSTKARHYLNMGDYAKSIRTGLDAIELLDKTGQKVYSGWMYVILSEAYMYNGDFGPGLASLETARQIFSELDVHSALGNTMLFESEVWQRMGETATALDLFKRGTAIRDSITSANNLERLNSLRLIMEQDILLNEKQKAELERDFEKERASKEFARRNLFMVTTFLVVMVAGLLGWRIHEKEKHRKQLMDINERLSHSEVQLRELNVSKDKFFGILSHDLRSPLYAFESLCDRLFVPEGGKQDEIIEKMKDQSRKLRELLNNILLWSKSEQGLLKMKAQALLIHDAVTGTFELFHEEANQKNITLLNETDPECLVFADQEAVHTILRNLINNAVKYAPNGPVTVKSMEHDSEIEIQVIDTGQGIPPEKMPELFAFSGNIRSGLGLLLCKQLAELNNGSIAIDSIIGRGTTVTLRLPKFQIA